VLRGSDSTALMATGFVYRKPDFRPLPTEPIAKDFGIDNYDLDPSHKRNLAQIRSRGFLFIPIFGNSPTGQTSRQIFTLDCSNDAGE